MTLKNKLIASMCMFTITIAIFVVGVWALKTINFTVGGNLSYIAPGVEATISKAVVGNGCWQNDSDALIKMPLTTITNSDTSSTLTDKFSYWQNVNLNFNENGDDITITFSITNNSSVKNLSIGVASSYQSATNCTISVNTTEIILSASQSHTFTLTMKIADKSENAEMINFAVVFNMQLVNGVKAEEISYLTFTYNDSERTAELSECSANAPAEVEIPSKVIYNNKVYTVTSIFVKFDIGEDWLSIFCETPVKSVIIPGTIEIIPFAAFRLADVENVILQEGVKEIGSYLSNTLKTISIPSSIEAIDVFAFSHCDNLRFTFYDNGKYLGNSKNPYLAFIETTSNDITSCKINENCKMLANEALAGLDNITSITIPKNVTHIDWMAICWCPNLATIQVLSTTVPSTGERNFQDCSSSLVIYVPTESVNAYKSADVWKDYNIQPKDF